MRRIFVDTLFLVEAGLASRLARLPAYIQQSETRQLGSELGIRKLTGLAILRHKRVGSKKPLQHNGCHFVTAENLFILSNSEAEPLLRVLTNSSKSTATSVHARAKSASSCSKAVAISLISLSGAPKARATSRQAIVASATSAMMRSASPRSRR